MQIKLFKKQLEFIYSTHKETLFSGGYGASKSTSLCWAALKHASKKGAVVLLTRKTLVSLKRTTLKTLENLLSINYKDFKKSENIISLYGGGEIILSGMDNIYKLGSFEAGVICIDEASEFTKDEYLSLLYRLRKKDTARQLFAVTNPATPNHWIFSRFYAERDPDRKVITMSSHENTFLPKDYIDMLNKMKINDEKKYRRLVLGEWCALDRAVYHNFDINKHVKDIEIEYKNINYDKILIGLDYGYTDPSAFIVVGILGELCFVLEETVKNHLLTDQLKNIAKELNEKYINYDPVFVYDPSAPLIASELAAIGLKVEKANNSIKEGINIVQSKLNIINNQPLLIIDHRCTNLLKDMDLYQYDNNNIPIDHGVHCGDALRYAIVSSVQGRIEDSSNSARVTLIDD